MTGFQTNKQTQKKPTGKYFLGFSQAD